MHVWMGWNGSAGADILGLSASAFQMCFSRLQPKASTVGCPILQKQGRISYCVLRSFKNLTKQTQKPKPKQTWLSEPLQHCQLSQFPCSFTCSKSSGGYFSHCSLPGAVSPGGRRVPLLVCAGLAGGHQRLFFSFVSKHLFPCFIFGGAGQWGPVSLHWESISTFYEMVFRIWFARNEWLSSTSSTKHSRYKWDMRLVSSGSYISRLFVNNCILFLVSLF